MTLQAGDKLMSLTDVSEMLGSPSTPCTAGGTRAMAQSATEWARRPAVKRFDAELKSLQYQRGHPFQRPQALRPADGPSDCQLI
jgi:hypothetical protein